MTEVLRFFYRLSGADIKPRAICLNSVCALPVGTLPIDSSIFQRTLSLGTTVLVWAFLAIALLAAVRLFVRAVSPPRCAVARLLRRVVTIRTVLIAVGCAIALAAIVAVTANFRSLGRIAAPYHGVEWATME